MRKSIAAGALLASFIPFLANAAALPDFSTMLSCFQGANSDTTRIQQCTDSFARQFSSEIRASVPAFGSDFTIPVRDSASVTLTTSQLHSCLQSTPARTAECIETFKNSLFSSLPSVASSSTVSIPTSQFITCIRNAGANLAAIQACKTSFLGSLPSSIQLPPTPDVSTLLGTSSVSRCIQEARGDFVRINACTRGFRTPLDSILDTVNPDIANVPPNVRTLITCVKNVQPGNTTAIRACRDSFASSTNPSGTSSSSAWTIPDTTQMPQNIRTLVTCLHDSQNSTVALAACHTAYRATLPAHTNSTGNPPIATSSASAETQTQVNALYAKIQQLMQQIQQLTPTVDARNPQAVQTPRPADPGTRPAVIARLKAILSFGSRGDDVCALQKFLSEDSSTGLTTDDVTCFFGKRTEQAVKNWQSSHGIVSEGDSATTGWGNVGPRTLTEINKAIDRPAR